jgi:hypothetical protein
MQTERIGIIAFLGIFMPGSYISGVLFFAMASCVKIYGSVGHAQTFNTISKNIALSSLAFFFISYLLGVLVRLFAPKVVDRMSKIYLYHARRKREKWVTDVFPYKDTISKRLINDGMEDIPDLIARLNDKYGRKNNTSFFNYCKWFVDANNAALSRQIHQAEALVRFLSGTTIALLIAILVAIIMLVISVYKGIVVLWLSYGGLLLISLLCLSLILERFKFQRRREVYMVWFCTFIILKGGILGNAPDDFEKFIKAVFFLRKTQEQDSNLALSVDS